jgi:hypothetical protein
MGGMEYYLDVVAAEKMRIERGWNLATVSRRANMRPSWAWGIIHRACMGRKAHIESIKKFANALGVSRHQQLMTILPPDKQRFAPPLTEEATKEISE